MPTLHELVELVRAIPYGRPSERTAAAVLAEGRGTCSTKHLLLRELAGEAVPQADVQLLHRVYELTPALAGTLFGAPVASAVPESGLVDVHTYATALVDGRRVRIDVTFPDGPPWDGRSDMPLACGDGIDVNAGDEPLATKERLVAEHCDAASRERFVAVLSG